MWTSVLILAIAGAVVLLVMRAVAKKRETPLREQQADVTETHPDEFPDVGDDDVARRRDGSVMPGSEEDRNRHGQL